MPSLNIYLPLHIGGPLTVTDANLILGRLRPEYFPNIFGLNEDQPLDLQISRKLFDKMTVAINAETGLNLTREEIAAGCVIFPLTFIYLKKLIAFQVLRSCKRSYVSPNTNSYRSSRLRHKYSQLGLVWRCWRAARLLYSESVRK